MTNATNFTEITASSPDFPSSTIKFKLLSSVAISGTEIFPGLVYTMTLDAVGDGTLNVPTPDADGTLAWLWEINLPDGRESNASISWAALSQDLATILAAAISTATPSDISQLITNKVDRTGDTMTGDLTFSAAGITTADTVGFNTSYAETGAEAVATRFWNSVKGTTTLITADGSALDDGQELRFYGKASGAIANGEYVQFAGAQGDHVLFKKVVPAEIIANRFLFMGVATTDIANGAFGNVAWIGYVNDINTTGWTQGDLLYMDNTTGQGTNVEPAAGEVKILVGVVIKEETSPAAANGEILIRPTFYARLTELEDVNSTPLTTTGQFMVWDQAAGYFDATDNITNYYLKTDFSASPGAAETPLKTSSTGTLTLNSSAQIPLALTSTNGTAYITVTSGGRTLQFGASAGSGAAVISTTTNDNILFLLNSIQKFAMTKDGNFGINTATQFGGASGVIGLANLTSAITSFPTGGGILYSEGESLTWAGSGKMVLRSSNTTGGDLQGIARTSGASQQLFRAAWTWTNSTLASRTSVTKFYANDFGAEREVIAIGANGTEATLGFYGVTPTARQLLATGTGATVDNVITALQNLGLLKQA